MGKHNKQNEKKKTVYIDDGSTIADMSPVTGKKSSKSSTKGSVPRSAFRDQMRTFTDAQRMMFLPMLAVLGCLALAFLIIYILL